MPSERIQLFIDILTGQSNSRLGRLTTDLKKADGAFAKTKVAGAALGGFLKQNLALGAAAAGTAFVGFAAKSVKAFTDAGRAAGLLRDQTKLTAEEASRLAEVGADIGIPVETLATAIGRMNRAAANTPEAFESIGASLKTARDGSLDVNETFLETIEAIRRIPKASEQADKAQKIFGRGWQQIAELITMGADDVRTALEGVSDAQVFDDAEIAKAREMHARLEDLQDDFLALQLTLGEFAVDVVDGMGVVSRAVEETWKQAKRLATFQDLRNALVGSSELTGEVADSLGNFTRQVEEAQGPVALTAEELVKMAQGYRDAGIAADVINGKLVIGAAAMRDAAEATDDAGSAASGFESRVQAAGHAERRLKDEAEKAAQAIRDLRAEVVQGLDSTFDYEEASLDLADSLDDLSDRWEDAGEAIDEFGENSDEANRATNDVRQAQLKAAEAALTAATAFADQSGAQEGSRRHTRLLKDELKRLADANPAIRGEIQKYIDKLDAIPKKKKTDADFEAEEATLAASEYDRRLSEIRTEINTTAHFHTADAMAAANAFEQRVASLGGSVTASAPSVPHRASGGPLGAGQTALVGEQGPELFMPSSSGSILSAGRTRSILSRLPGSRALSRSARLGAQADKLRDEARALNELAKATEDAEEKKKLLEQRDELLDRAENKLRRSTDLAEQAQRSHADALEARADGLRDLADAHREAADAARESAQAEADALTEQANSLRESVDARLSLADATDAAREAAEAATEAHRTFGLSTQERARIDREAQRAALALADAQVQAAREAAQANRVTLTAAQETAIFQRSLSNQVTGASNELRPVLQALVGSLRLGDEIARERRAEQVVAQGERAAEKQLVSADKNLAAADKLSAAADTLNARNMERILRSLLKAQGVLTRKEIERALRGIAA